MDGSVSSVNANRTIKMKWKKEQKRYFNGIFDRIDENSFFFLSFNEESEREKE